MADYEKIIPLTLVHEGGWSDDPEDTGGATKYGVSLTFAKSTRDKMFDKDGDGRITRNDIKLLTKADAAAAFRKYFWNKPYGLDSLDSDKKAYVVFDAAMNNGPANATRFIQRACRTLGYNLEVDGVYGPMTKKALEDAPVDEFCEAFLDYRERFFHAIVKNRPSQKVFLKGWLNRINAIRKDLQNLMC